MGFRMARRYAIYFIMFAFCFGMGLRAPSWACRWCSFLLQGLAPLKIGSVASKGTDSLSPFATIVWGMRCRVSFMECCCFLHGVRWCCFVFMNFIARKHPRDVSGKDRVFHHLLTQPRLGLFFPCICIAGQSPSWLTMAMTHIPRYIQKISLH